MHQMDKDPNLEQRRKPLNPLTVWRWGFTVILLATGTWLVIYGPQFADIHGRTLGWVVIGYAVVRLILGQFSGVDKGRGRSLRRTRSEGESA